MTEQLLVEVLEPGADVERLSALAHSLRGDLLQLDVQSVSALRQGTPPPGTRALDAAAFSTLVVALNGSVALLEHVVSTVRAWLNRTPDAQGTGRSLKVTLNGQTLELSAVSEAQQEQVVQEFLRTALANPPGKPVSGAS